MLVKVSSVLHAKYQGSGTDDSNDRDLVGKKSKRKKSSSFGDSNRAVSTIGIGPNALPQ
jgi:hypothetical protein